MGLHSGPLAQRSRRLPETDSSHFELTPQRSHKQSWPLTRASAQLPRTASHASPPRTLKTRHTDSPVSPHGCTGESSHGPRLHTVRFTPHTPRAVKGRPGRLLHSRNLPARTHLLPHASPLPAAARPPPPFPAVQTSDFFSLRPAEERPLVPGAGRAGQPQQATQHCCSLVPPGGPGRAEPLLCGDPRTLRVSEKCTFPALLPNTPPPQLLFPALSSLSPDCPRLYSPAAGDSSFPSRPFPSKVL